MEKVQLTSCINTLFNPCVPQPFLAGTSKCSESFDDSSKFIISREFKQVVVNTGERDTDFVLKNKVVETSRVDRQAYIDSFKDDAGILNIMKKVALTGDLSLLSPRKSAGSDLVDISGIDDPESIRVKIKAADDLLANIPEDLKNAILNMSNDELVEFLNKNKAKSSEDSNEEVK